MTDDNVITACGISDNANLEYSMAADGLLKINSNHMGFYRVNHDNSMWDAISNELQKNHLVKPRHCTFTHKYP